MEDWKWRATLFGLMAGWALAGLLLLDPWKERNKNSSSISPTSRISESLSTHTPSRPSSRSPSRATAAAPGRLPIQKTKLPSREIWRVRGVPPDHDKAELASVLRTHPALNCPESHNGAELLTLAPDLGRGTPQQVATVVFRNTPTLLAKAIPNRRETVIELSRGNSKTVFLTVDMDFDGLTVLSSPAEKLKDDHVNILVMSELGGHPVGSFMDKDSKHLWIIDSLPQDQPFARIITYGYRTHLSNVSSFAEIDHLGEHLHHSLSDILDEYPQPLVIIAHSLGGLVVKEALSVMSPERLALVSSVMFFGVPHHGVNIKSFLPMVNMKASQPLVQSIDSTSSRRLERLHMSWAQTLKKTNLKVFCFYEMIMSPTALWIDSENRYRITGKEDFLVSESSATACFREDDPWRERVCGLDKTHSDLVKFGPDDRAYHRVLSFLRQLGELTQRPQTRPAPNTRQPRLSNQTTISSQRPARERWRVQGIPSDLDTTTLVKLLLAHPDLHCPDGHNGVEVKTLAFSLRTGTPRKVATVHFKRLPHRLSERHVFYIDIRVRDAKAIKLALDRDFIGTTVLFSPPTSPRMNVLFISGLNGHAVGSFIDKESQHFWLTDDLPEDLPTARIMTYGYHTKMESYNAIRKFAENLRAVLSEVLRLSNIPLVIVAHSLGGLVFKDAFYIMSKDEQISHLVGLISGVIFFGVPNNGMKIEHLLPMFDKSPSATLVESLDYISSTILRDQQINWKEALAKSKFSKIFCFYEALPSPTAIQIDGKWRMGGPEEFLVSEGSARDCFPGGISVHEHAYGVDKTHSDLVKFTPHEEAYNRFMDYLNQILPEPSSGSTESPVEDRNLLRRTSPYLFSRQEALYDEESSEDEGVLSAEKAHKIPAPLYEAADQWISDFKKMRIQYGIGRESQRIRVAVLDTGLDASHPNFIKNRSRIKDYKSFVENGDPQVDQFGHGTHIAGIILDLTSNVDLYIAQITDNAHDVNLGQISKALQWARTEWCVNIISLSTDYHDSGGPDSVKREIDKCLNDNITVFAPASNDGAYARHRNPRKYDRVLYIHSASGQGDASNFNPPAEEGTEMDNFAVLGVGIKSEWPICLRDGVGYQRMSGTSVATPVAVSIAAFWIGYIRTRKQLKGLGWNRDPLSPEGVRTIFRMVSQGNKSRGYDLVFPRRFVTRNSKIVICEMLKQELGAYPIQP